VAFAAGSKDYLYTEQQSVANAWGPLHLGIDQWLYWDLDNRTGYRTFGITIVEPIVASSMPSSPVMDQHWFDTTACEMKVWTGNVWSKKIRTFACKLAQGRVPVSMSANSPSFIGTQVGNTSDTYAGHIIYDATTNNAIKNANGQFVTTEDKLSTKTISLSQVKVASIIVEGEAQQNMAAHTIVVFSEFGKIVHADQFVAEQPIQFGIIESTAVVGQTVNVVTSGMVTSQAFDFSAIGVNALLYCNATGQLVSTPVVPNQTPVAVVVDRKTIQLGVALASSTDTIPVINLATDTVYGISRLSVPAEDAEDPIVVGDNDPRFDSYVRKTGDTMTGPLYLYGGPTQDLHAATKKYVDDSRTPAAGNQYEVQYNIGGQFAASNSLRLNLPDENYNTMSLNVGSADHISATITTSTWAGNLQVEAGGRQDSQPGSAVLQGGALFTTTSPAGGPGSIFGGHAMVTGGPAGGSFGRAGDAWIQGGTGEWVNGRAIIDGGTNFDVAMGRSTADGGSVQIAGGAAQGATSTHNGGSVSISGGRAEGSGTPGSIQLFTSGQSRVLYSPTGAWLLGTTQEAGINGQVLTSRGPTQPPIWQDTAAGSGLADRIVSGNTMLRVRDDPAGVDSILTFGSVAAVTSNIDRTTFINNSTPSWVSAINSISTNDENSSVAVDSDGNTIVIGSATGNPTYLYKYDPAGTLLWSKSFLAQDEEFPPLNRSGQYVVIDTTDNIYALFSDAENVSTLVKLSASGNVMWQVDIGDTQQMGDLWSGQLIGLDVSPDQSTIVVCGRSWVSWLPTIMMLSATDGSLIRQLDIQIDSANAGDVTGVSVTTSNTIVVVGTFYDTVVDNSGSFTACVTITGDLLWKKVKRDNGSAQRWVFANSVDTDSTYAYVLGSYETYDVNTDTYFRYLMLTKRRLSDGVTLLDKTLFNTELTEANQLYVGAVACDATNSEIVYLTAYNDQLGGDLYVVGVDTTNDTVTSSTKYTYNGEFTNNKFPEGAGIRSIATTQTNIVVTGYYTQGTVPA
jgi:hypothetical protein